VRIYVCGLTPSAQAHIGHAKTYIFFDVLRRYLLHLGYDVTYVQNVTDIDDRSIARANETGENWRDIVMGFYASFKKSWERLGLMPIDPKLEPFATGYIPQIIGMIDELVNTGHAYASKDGVYYRVASFPRYGELSHRNVEELKSGARIEVDEFKDDPLDFALWKFAKPGEPSWESPWGAGRPGWHIECSAMARELLGWSFDIHGGGADLIFPHHENEIAQTEAVMPAPQHPMANFWVHGGLLLFERKKMSKSLGNFEPLSDLLDRHDPQAIRLLFLQTGYSKVMNFTEDSIGAAKVTLEKIKDGYRKLHALADGKFGAERVESALTGEVESALDEDMNTSVALSKVLAAAVPVEPFLAQHGGNAADALAELDHLLDVLGLSPSAAWLVAGNVQLPADFLQKLLAEVGAEISLNGSSAEDAVRRVIAARNQARADKNWAESDRLRDALARCGVTLKDTKEGTTWTVAG
jgi:cysteinyl-tRNA synthetase